MNLSSTCPLLGSLRTLDLSNNQMTALPVGFTSRLASLENGFFQNNQLTDAPITAFYNINYLQTINFSGNKLTALELWVTRVKKFADFSSNKISIITNNANYNLSGRDTLSNKISMTNNGQMNLTDGIYEMYGSCSEVQSVLNDSITTGNPAVTTGLFNIDFGTTTIDCTCNVRYMVEEIGRAHV